MGIKRNLEQKAQEMLDCFPAIAILATGDEITQGTILNTNAQKMAQEMFGHGLETGWQICVSDDEDAIQEALGILLQKHVAVITIGGLGPTSDDKTRFALANYLQEPLVEDRESLANLMARYQKINIPFSDMSKQQALFPQSAKVLENITGSANGCLCTQQVGKNIFMLPGPPHECLPMFQTYVLPYLKEKYATENIQLLWKVFGVAEGVIAEKMDAILKPYEALCRTAFRWNYPYVDCKVILDKNLPEKEEIVLQLNNLLSPYQLDSNNQTATERLKNYFAQSQQPIYIHDHATGGILESRLRSNTNYSTLFFHKTPTKKSVFFQIGGLENYWKGEESVESELTFTSSNGTRIIKVPYRKMYLEEYAAELIAHEIYKELI